MAPRQKPKQLSKLDEMLRAAANPELKKTSAVVDVSKALASGSHRLISEKIVFSKATKVLTDDTLYAFKGFQVLDPSKDALAKLKLEMNDSPKGPHGKTFQKSQRKTTSQTRKAKRK